MDRGKEGDGLGAQLVLRSVRVLQKDLEVSCQLRAALIPARCVALFVPTVAELLLHP